jgi:thiosulfate/3-mercaptopyruvate sulfurtransferase
MPGEERQPIESGRSQSGGPPDELLIAPHTLAGCLGEPDVTILDARGPVQFRASHIPGAISVPTSTVQDPRSPRAELFPPLTIASRLGAMGVPDNGKLVLYDDSGLVPSALLFWTLELLGRSRVAILDGGYTAWRALGLPVESGTRDASPASFRTALVPERRASKADVIEAVKRGGAQVVDSRSPDEYCGRRITGARGGHIPGAVNVDWERHIVGLLNPTFRPISELRQLYEEAGITADRPVITYCLSGARSSHAYFVLRMLGYPVVRNYVDSWLEWADDPTVPVAGDPGGRH